jgi:hypothetical protein
MVKENIPMRKYIAIAGKSLSSHQGKGQTNIGVRLILHYTEVEITRTETHLANV